MATWGRAWPQANGLRVAIPDGQGGILWVLQSRLEAVESVFAMTVHKSQGSEFDHVCLVLLDRQRRINYDLDVHSVILSLAACRT